MNFSFKISSKSKLYLKIKTFFFFLYEIISNSSNKISNCKYLCLFNVSIMIYWIRKKFNDTQLEYINDASQQKVATLKGVTQQSTVCNSLFRANQVSIDQT